MLPWAPGLLRPVLPPVTCGASGDGGTPRPCGPPAAACPRHNTRRGAVGGETHWQTWVECRSRRQRDLARRWHSSLGLAHDHQPQLGAWRSRTHRPPGRHMYGRGAAPSHPTWHAGWARGPTGPALSRLDQPMRHAQHDQPSGLQVRPGRTGTTIRDHFMEPPGGTLWNHLREPPPITAIS